MNITILRFSRTIQPVQYESFRCEVEASPAEGQTTDELLKEVKTFVDSACDMARKEYGTPTTVATPSKKTDKAETDPPLAGNKPTSKKRGRPKGSKNKSSDSTSKTGTSKTTKAATAETEDAMAVKLLEELKATETHEDFMAAFNKMRAASTVGKFGTPDNWARVCKDAANHYRTLNGDDEKVKSQIVDAFKAERQAIANAKKQAE